MSDEHVGSIFEEHEDSIYKMYEECKRLEELFPVAPIEFHDGNKYYDDKGHEIAVFLGRGFDVTRMKERPKKKRRDSETQKKEKKVTVSKTAPLQGNSNTLQSISQVSTLETKSRLGFNAVSSPETSPRDGFRATETATCFDLWQKYANGYQTRGVQLTFSDVSVFETFNDDNFGKRPAVADRLPTPRHFKDPSKVLNPWGPFVGFDWGQARYFGKWDYSIWREFLPWFGEAYKRHQELREPIIFQYYAGSEKWSFRCAGYKERSSLGFPNESELPYIYVLELGGLKIYLVPPDVYENPSVPNVVLVMGAECFRDCVPASVVEREALDFLSQFGFTVESRKLDRIDIQVTTDRYTVDDVKNAKENNKIVCMSNKRATFDDVGRTVTGNKKGDTLYFGKRTNRTCVLRVYDKLAELEDKQHLDRGRTAYYYCSCLGLEYDSVLSHLTRFEFELHRKMFNQFQVTDFSDFEKKLPSIVEYLTTKWFRIIETEKGYNHSSRAKTSKIWQDISETFRAVADYFATEKGGAISVTRRTKEERPYLNPNWQKTVKTAVEFVSRAVGEFALALGVDDGGQIDKNFYDLVLYPMLCGRRRHIRDYVARRGAGYIKSRRFLVYNIRDYVAPKSEVALPKIETETPID